MDTDKINGLLDVITKSAGHPLYSPIRAMAAKELDEINENCKADLKTEAEAKVKAGADEYHAREQERIERAAERKAKDESVVELPPGPNPALMPESPPEEVVPQPMTDAEAHDATSFASQTRPTAADASRTPIRRL